MNKRQSERRDKEKKRKTNNRPRGEVLVREKINEPILVSGDAQVSSPCGLHCGDREQPKNLLLHPPDRGASSLSESEDCTVEVLTGVLDTCGNNSDVATLSCQYCKKKPSSASVVYPGILQHVGIESQIAPNAKRFFEI